jgi:hypothetical protein
VARALQHHHLLREAVQARPDVHHLLAQLLEQGLGQRQGVAVVAKVHGVALQVYDERRGGPRVRVDERRGVR